MPKTMVFSSPRAMNSGSTEASMQSSMLILYPSLLPVMNPETRAQRPPYSSAAAAMDATEKLLSQGARGFVFDLRSNPGGLLSELTELLDYLLPSGTIFISVDKSGEQTAIESDSVCLDMPMAVIVNEYTYSAAEFFAAALQDYNWAEIIGVRTTGKSRSQQTVELSDGSAIHLSTATYLTPRGVDLAEQGGVIPDQEVAITSSGDSQLSAALMAVQWNM